MQSADIIIGNSSSGIYEVPSFKKATINLGNRQKGRLMASSVINSKIEGNKLPLKKEFDWNLGPSSAVLKRQYDADYALLIFVRDSYSSGERIMFQVLSALLIGYMPGGGVQAGYASLLDLNKGKIVWYNHLYKHYDVLLWL